MRRSSEFAGCGSRSISQTVALSRAPMSSLLEVNDKPYLEVTAFNTGQPAPAISSTMAGHFLSVQKMILERAAMSFLFVSTEKKRISNGPNNEF